jgi:hypothetical protein
MDALERPNANREPLPHSAAPDSAVRSSCGYHDGRSGALFERMDPERADREARAHDDSGEEHANSALKLVGRLDREHGGSPYSL